MNNEQWIIWCGLDAEQDKVCKILDRKEISYSSIYGSLKPDEKEKRLIEWIDGETQILVIKPKIGMFGLNLQQCHNMMFVGLGDSWESYYQCIRRVYRFGQKKPVNVYIVLSEVEREIFDNVMNKEKQAKHMQEQLITHVRDYEKKELELRTKIESIEHNDNISFILPEFLRR